MNCCRGLKRTGTYGSFAPPRHAGTLKPSPRVSTVGSCHSGHTKRVVTMKFLCPACRAESALRINVDSLVCPVHGEIDGFTMQRIGKQRGWRALIEIRAAQAHREISELARG